MVDDNWDGLPYSCWIEVVTKHRTMRQFRRIAIANYKETNEFTGWCGVGRFLKHPRSNIDEIIIVRDGHTPVVTDHLLKPLSEDDEIWIEGKQHSAYDRHTVASRLEIVTHCLEDVYATHTTPRDDNGDEDPSSDDGTGSEERAAKHGMVMNRVEGVEIHPDLHAAQDNKASTKVDMHGSD